MISVEHHRFNHKGGQLQFGPDGKLYAAFGDGGGGGDPDRNAQNLGRHARQADPHRATSPTAATRCPPTTRSSGARGALREIYAYGLRNPYRFSFDRAQRRADDRPTSARTRSRRSTTCAGRAGGLPPRGGMNFGWSVFEGRSRYNGGRAPGARARRRSTHSHDDGWCSIIGGYVIRDPTLGPDLRGRYVYGDYCRSGLRVAQTRRRGRARSRALGLRVSSLVSFGEDGRGHVYAISSNGGIYRIAPR